tara:strand:- start:426 stop:764 length:339 start_codon:yes stop_codon:yes gene_type:complete
MKLKYTTMDYKDKQPYEYKRICDCNEKCSKECTFMGGSKIEENDGLVPEYYKGKNGYQARKVVDNFDLTYNLGTATTYILRAYKKHDSAKECIEKAIHHLRFELENLENGED